VYAVLRHSTLKTLQQLTAHINSHLSIILTRIIHILEASYLSSQSGNNLNSSCDHQDQSFSFDSHQSRILHSATLFHFLSFITTRYQSQFKLQARGRIVLSKTYPRYGWGSFVEDYFWNISGQPEMGPLVLVKWKRDADVPEIIQWGLLGIEATPNHWTSFHKTRWTTPHGRLRLRHDLTAILRRKSHERPWDRSC